MVRVPSSRGRPAGGVTLLHENFGLSLKFAEVGHSVIKPVFTAIVQAAPRGYGADRGEDDLILKHRVSPLRRWDGPAVESQADEEEYRAEVSKWLPKEQQGGSTNVRADVRFGRDLGEDRTPAQEPADGKEDPADQAGGSSWAHSRILNRNEPGP